MPSLSRKESKADPVCRLALLFSLAIFTCSPFFHSLPGNIDVLLRCPSRSLLEEMDKDHPGVANKEERAIFLTLDRMPHLVERLLEFASSGPQSIHVRLVDPPVQFDEA